MSNMFFFFVFLFLISLQNPVLISASDTLPTVYWKELHDLEAAQFLYRTGDYLSALLTCDTILNNSKDESIRDRAMILKIRSDLSLRYAISENSYQIPQEANPHIFSIFNILYKSGDYNEIVSLSQETKNSVALYFKGMALYKLGRISEAIKPLKEISREDEIYPYAKILLMQTMVSMGDLKSGERHLKDMPLNRGGKIAGSVRLFLGYLYLEMGEFEKAEESFLRVDVKSEFYGASRSGMAWSKIRRGLYEEALSLKEALSAFPSHDIMRYESMLAIAHCYQSLGKLNEARDWFLKAIEGLRILKDDFKKLYKTGDMHKAYINSITKDGKDMPYISFFQDDPDIIRITAYFRAFDNIKRKYEKLEEEAELTYLNLKERITAKEERLAKTAERLANTKQLLSILAKRISAVDEKALDNNDAKVVERWQKILNRPLTATEKGIIHLLVRERGSGLWCLNNAIYSPSLCMVPGPGIDGVRNETNERIINDLNTVLKGERIVYEQRLHSISTALNKRVEYERGVLKDMEAFKEEKLLRNKDMAQRGIDDAIGLLSDLVDRRARMIQYEADVFMKKTVSGLNKIDKAEEGR